MKKHLGLNLKIFSAASATSVASAVGLIAALLVVQSVSGFLPASEAKKSSGATTSEPADENFQQGVGRYKNHDFDGAIDSFLQATYFARNGYHPEAYYWLGKSYMAKHDDVKAIEAFKKHIAQNMKKTPQAHCYLAEIYLRDNKDEMASDEAKNALTEAMGPCPEAHLIIAKLMCKRGGYTDAEDHFLLALGDHPWHFTEAWMCYAESRMQARKFTDAYDLFQKMVEAKGRLENLDLSKVYLDMGVCRISRGDDQGAIDHWHQSLEVNPNEAKSHLELAMVFEKEQHYSSAIKEYSLYCSTTEPDDPKLKLAKDKIIKLEQKLNADNATPTIAPSPYMRQQQMMQMQKIQQQQAPRDPGF
jgi:tetratricopeptide (TPR) repeat protein